MRLGAGRPSREDWSQSKGAPVDGGQVMALRDGSVL